MSDFYTILDCLVLIPVMRTSWASTSGVSVNLPRSRFQSRVSSVSDYGKGCPKRVKREKAEGFTF